MSGHPPAPCRLALVLAFEGTEFAGWQSQNARGERTVQETLEAALSQLQGGERVVVEGAGRTDAGVHATGAVAHVDLPRLPGTPRRRLNGVLPKDLRVRGAALMPGTFHARKSASGKRYSYRFWLDASACPLRRRCTLHVPQRLDLGAMREAAARFVGDRDFASLQAAGSSVITSRREVTRCELVGRPPEVSLVVEGSGFLRHMVRAMAGSLLDVGHGRRDPAWIDAMLAALSRDAAGANAPPHGLVLEEVFYPEPFAGLLRRALSGEDPAETPLAPAGEAGEGNEA